jgi:hypothetical protein
MSRRTNTPYAVAKSLVKTKEKEAALNEYVQKHQALKDAHYSKKKKDMEGLVRTY